MFLEKFGFLLPGIPAVGLAICVGASLFSYEAPTYGQESSSTESVAQESTSTEAAAVKKGNFDLDDGVYRGTGVGFSGNTVVDVTISDKTITAIDIISEEDTDAFFNRAKEGVIKEILEQQSYDVDAVSGATYSSRGIKNAVKNALTGEEDTSTRGDGGGSSAGSTGSADVSDITEGTFEDGTYTGSGQGFSGTTTVRVTVKNHKITSIEVLSHADADSYFNKAKSGVISAIISGNTTNVDTVSGATYSSRGIINAVRNALGLSSSGGSSSGGGSAAAAGGSSSGGSKSLGKVSDKEWKDGTYTGSGQGFSGTTTVRVTVKDHKIASITVLSHADADSFFNKARGVISKMVGGKTTNVSAVSGATYSSNGIISAVRNALSKAGGSSSSNSGSGSSENAGKNTSKNNNSSKNNSVTPITGTYKDGTYSATATCKDNDETFNYTITTTVTVKDNKVTNVTATANGIDSSSRTFFNSANATVPKNIVSKQSTTVDTVSGATYSSRAIMTGAANALAKAKISSETAKVDRSKLNSAISNAASLAEQTYTPSSWKTFTDAFAAAVEASASSSQSDIDEKTEALQSAIENLVKRADKTALEKTISDVKTQMESLNQSDYTDASWKNLEDALSAAQAADSDLETTQSKADNAATALQNAFDGLGEEIHAYTATAQCTDGDDGDFNYNIKVTITMQGSKITKCEVASDDIDDDSTRYFGWAQNGRTRNGKTYTSVTQQIVDKQSADNIDTVSGATYSSNAIIKAAKDAIAQSKK